MAAQGEYILESITDTVPQTSHSTAEIKTADASMSPELRRNVQRGQPLPTDLRSTLDYFGRSRDYKRSQTRQGS